jgi:hypothetical protein
MAMAKGQKRSGREAKKPKKAVSPKPREGVASAFAQEAPGMATKHHAKKG